MTSYQTPDSKKEEFRKYLEKSGVIDALTKGTEESCWCSRGSFDRRTPALAAVLVGLYEEPERPPNAVDYVKRYMGAPTGIDVEALRQENEALRKEREELRSTINELNARLTEDAKPDED